MSTSIDHRSDYFKWVFEHAPVAIAVLDANDIWLDANPAMCEMLRMRKEDLIGSDYKAWTPDEALEERDQARVEFERTGTLRGKFILYRSPVDLVHMDLHAAILDGGKRLVMASDITDREEARAELARTRERLLLALSAGEVATWFWDVVNGKIYGDENLALFYNVGPEDIHGGPPEKYIASFHPEDSERVQQVLADALGSNAKTYEAEFRLIGSDGLTRWVLGRGTIERDEQGAPLRVPGVLLNITERKKAQQELERTRERLDLALAAGDVATWVWDIREDRLYADKNLELYFNIGKNDADGSPLAEYMKAIHPDDRDSVTTTINDALEKSPDIFTEYRARGADGRWRWLLVRGTIERDDSGKAVRLPGVALDITRRKQAEEALRESQHRFETLFSVIDEGYCLCEIITNDEGRPVDYRFLEVNPQFEHFTGLKDAVGRRAYEAIPGLEPAWAEAYGKVALGGRPTRFQMGSEAMGRFFDVFAAPMMPHGRFSLVFKDITAARASAEALRKSEERKASILASAMDCIITMDHEGRIVDFNPAAERTFGHRSDDVVGRTVAEVIIPERLRTAHWEGMKRYLETGEQRILGQLVELPALRADGSEFHAEISINVVGSAGGPPFFTAFLRDITERKAIEASLKDADRKKDEFIATMAHELRNPLAPIRTALDVLQSKGVPEETNQEMLRLMDRQLSHMVHLIEDLLDVSRISQGKIELRKQLLDLSSVIHEAVEANKPYCNTAGTSIELDLPRRSFLLYADRTRLIQVIGNLLHNACKFSRHGTSIHVQVKELDSVAEIRVKDQGIGIAAERLPDIFTMFSQVEAPLDRSHGGLGIGLSLVKSMVELHGGSVEAHSEGLGKGSEFIIRIPMIPVPAMEGERTRQDKGAGPARRLRVLIADDHLDTIQSLSALLTVHGHEVHVAHDGAQAVEISKRVDPHVAILDIGMPRLNGYEAAANIRERSTNGRPVLAALTGWGQLHDRERSREAGFDHHMVKPVEPSRLLEWLNGLELNGG